MKKISNNFYQSFGLLSFGMKYVVDKILFLFKKFHSFIVQHCSVPKVQAVNDEPS